MLDHEFQSIMIPTFCTKDSEIPEEQYIAILLKTLKEYIDENGQEMKGKRIGFKTLPLPKRDQQLDSLVEQYSKKVRKMKKTSIKRQDAVIESSENGNYYQDSREETKTEKIEATSYDSPKPSEQTQKLQNQINDLQEKNQKLQELVNSLKNEIIQQEETKDSTLEEPVIETPRDDIDQDPKADISATTDYEDLQKKNIELEQNFEELKEKYLKSKAKKKEIKNKNKELENKNTELENINVQLEKQTEKDIEEYNELIKRYEKYKKRCQAYKSKEESKGIPKVPRKPSRDRSHPPKIKSKDEIKKPTASNLHKSTLP